MLFFVTQRFCCRNRVPHCQHAVQRRQSTFDSLPHVRSFIRSERLTVSLGRFKHFEWIRDRLVQGCPGMCAHFCLLSYHGFCSQDTLFRHCRCKPAGTRKVCHTYCRHLRGLTFAAFCAVDDAALQKQLQTFMNSCAANAAVQTREDYRLFLTLTEPVRSLLVFCVVTRCSWQQLNAKMTEKLVSVGVMTTRQLDDSTFERELERHRADDDKFAAAGALAAGIVTEV